MHNIHTMMEKEALPVKSWGLSDKGCVRAQNQDAYQIVQLDRSCLLCVLCDGMGGAKSGNIAANWRWTSLLRKSAAITRTE